MTLCISDYEAIARAESKILQAERLMEEADNILEPIVKAVVATDSIEEMSALERVLPRGFYKSELRVIISRN
jgi:hypothetical protein